MSTNAAVAGLRILPTQHTVADVLQRVQALARARGLTKNIAALGALAAAAAAQDP